MIARSKRPSPRKTATTEGAPKPRPRTNRSAVIKRMWRAADAQVREIETRLLQDSNEPLERERDARVLAVLAKTLRELSALDAAKPKKRTSASVDDDEIPRDMDELRRSLARKLAALVGDGSAALPGES